MRTNHRALMMTASVTLTDPQLRVLRSLLRRGGPAELLHYCLSRSGVIQAKWATLAAGLVEEAAGG